MSRGQLFIVAAPSGGGKTSLVNALLKSINKLKISISHTTRSPRPGEREGVDYYFTQEQQFAAMVAEEQFLEHAVVFGHQYGTSKQWVVEQIAQGFDIILEIDWQGAEQIRQIIADTVSIFIVPPSLACLSKRLNARQQDQPQVIARRMALAQEEMRHYTEFDYLVVNDEFEHALAGLKHIVEAQRLRVDRQAKQQQLLLADLLQKQ